MVVGRIAAGVSGKFGGVFSWEASIGEGRAVSNCMMLVVVRSRERLHFQPMPAEKKQKLGENLLIPQLFLTLCQPTLLAASSPTPRLWGGTPTPASYTYTTKAIHSSFTLNNIRSVNTYRARVKHHAGCWEFKDE